MWKRENKFTLRADGANLRRKMFFSNKGLSVSYVTQFELLFEKEMRNGKILTAYDNEGKWK